MIYTLIYLWVRGLLRDSSAVQALLIDLSWEIVSDTRQVAPKNNNNPTPPPPKKKKQQQKNKKKKKKKNRDLGFWWKNSEPNTGHFQRDADVMVDIEDLTWVVISYEIYMSGHFIWNLWNEPSASFINFILNDHECKILFIIWPFYIGFYCF